MISASAGSMAVLMTSLVANHGIQYLFAATILTGILQYLMGVLKLGKWMRYVPRSVIIGFINSLAILIFLSQLRYFDGASWGMYAMVIGTLLIIYTLPRISKAIPSPLVAVTVMMVLSVMFGFHLQTVGDIASLTPVLPSFSLPQVPWTWETLAIIFPVSLSLAVVGYTETLLTQEIIDGMTGEQTSKDKEMKGQGIANTVAGFFGGMAGCALIAESVINVKVGGKGRLSALIAAIVLLVLVFALGPIVNLIPMAALVGVMIMVCIAIFDWNSLGTLHLKPISDVVAMIITVIVVVATHDLAKGVIVGVILHGIIQFIKTKQFFVIPTVKKSTISANKSA